MKKLSVQISNCLLPLAIFYHPTLTAAEQKTNQSAAQSNFIQLGAEYEYSDNIYKASINPESSKHTRADIELSYAKEHDTNNIALNYKAEYTNESNNQLDDSRFWSGKGIFSQEIFTKNLLFGLVHERERFTVDENKASVSSNETDRNILTVDQQWFIPYSDRSNFILSVEYSQAKFHEFSSKDNTSNTGAASWQHRLNRQLQIQLSYSNSNVEFKTDSNSYRKHQLNAQLSGKYSLGNYSLTFGESRADYQNEQYNGANYMLEVDALIKRHLLTLSAARNLSDSSRRQGNSNELDFFHNQLVWTTQVNLSHQYTMLDGRLTSSSSVYFNKDQAIINISETQDSDSQGISTQLDWPITTNWNAGLFLHYKQSDLYSGDKKKQTEAIISSRVNIADSLYLVFRIGWDQQEFNLNNSTSTEQTYATRIVFRY